MENFIKKVEEKKKRHEELAEEIGKPEVISDQERYKELTKEYSDIGPVVEKYNEYQSVLKHAEEVREILEKKEGDEEFLSLAEAEIKELDEKQASLEKEMKQLLIPPDPDAKRNTILEIRAGTGGEESCLFAAELFRMYSKFAEKKNWKVEVMSSNPTGLGGVKEIVFMVAGKGAFGRLKYESGTHRVQRVPVTETSGRIHTSAATVAVLPEAKEIEVDINPNDLKIDTFRASGRGGQHVNVTDSAVRITHLPTGLVVSCQEERSQHKNKAKALKVLGARLYDKLRRDEQAKIASQRKKQVGTGDRSQKIRTYNYPQNRVTDHRITLTLYKLGHFLDGDLDEVIDALKLADQD